MTPGDPFDAATDVCAERVTATGLPEVPTVCRQVLVPVFLTRGLVQVRPLASRRLDSRTRVGLGRRAYSDLYPYSARRHLAYRGLTLNLCVMDYPHLPL